MSKKLSSDYDIDEHYQSYLETAWDIMTDVIEWDSDDFVDEYSTSGDRTYRDYYNLYRRLYQHEESVMEEPCKHDNQPQVCVDCE